MNRNKGFGIYLDRTLKKISIAYLKTFKENNVDLTIEQWVILQRIFLLGNEASQSEIVKTNFRNRATTSRVISGLCKKEFIKKERFDGDLKRYKLNITDTGHEVIQKVMPLSQNLRAIAHKGINDDEFGVFLRVLDQIWENYDAIDLD